MRVILVGLFLSGFTLVNAQILLQGKVLDKRTNQGIAFVAVGIYKKPIGVIGDEQGQFILKSKLIEQDDSIQITAIGYKARLFCLAELTGNELMRTIVLEPEQIKLTEVAVDAKKLYSKVLGTTRYSVKNCSGFVKNEESWKGSESAILIENKRDALVDDFRFFIIRNSYTDSLQFRLMFYEKQADGKVGETFLKKPILFKLKQVKGEFILPLREYNIRASGDFFVSLECLMDEMDITQFCYAGSYKVPSYIKASHFQRWRRIRGGGSDYGVKVSYTKE